MTGRDERLAFKPVDSAQPTGHAALFRLADTIEGLRGWRQRLAAFAAGVASILAMAPFNTWAVLWLTLPVLCLTIDGALRAPAQVSRWWFWRRWPLGRVAEIGWWFGFGYHMVGLFWIGEAFLVEAEIFAWLLPFAVTLLPAGLGLFTALAAVMSRAAPQSTAIVRAIALAIGFGITEWLRGHILTGFPWNTLGLALTSPLALMQSVAVFGIYGLTLLAVVIFAGPFALLRDGRGDPRRQRLAPALCLALVPLAVLWAAGAWRLKGGPPPVAQTAPIVRLVQPSISQWERMQPENMRRVFDQHLAMSLTAPNGTIDNAAGVALIVWPEAAMPFVPLSQPVALEAIGQMLPVGTRLASGALRLETFGGRRKVYNSVLIFERGEGTARLAGSYDKLHLVPFGEYLPAQSVLEAIGLQQITRQRGGFDRGEGPRASIALTPFGQVLPLICYEVIFPERLTGGRPDLVLTVTNDGWFGNTTGPRQHYHQARVRAVELGIPMIRASSNGISALVDGMGRELGRLELNAVGTLDVTPPPALAAPLYARLGDWIFFTLTGVLALWMGVKSGWLRKIEHTITKK